MRRVVVVGTTGSGKSTLAEQLATRLGGAFVDIDALNWGPDWTPAPIPLLRERMSVALAGDCWVVAGNYSKVRDIVWGRADTLIWLDYPLPFILWRLFRRTVRRVATQEELWGGNRERFWAQFASRDSLFLWALQTHYRRRREFPADLAKPEYAHLRVLRFRRPRDLEWWLAAWPVS
jgi:adenylate kinase family enzyme